MTIVKADKHKVKELCEKRMEAIRNVRKELDKQAYESFKTYKKWVFFGRFLNGKEIEQKMKESYYWRNNFYSWEENICRELCDACVVASTDIIYLSSEHCKFIKEDFEEKYKRDTE